MMISCKCYFNVKSDYRKLIQREAWIIIYVWSGPDQHLLGASDRLRIWHPFKPISIKLFFFCLGQGWRKILRARALISDNFRRNSFTYGNLSLVAPYFQLFQRCLSARNRLAPWAAAWLAGLLIQPWVWYPKYGDGRKYGMIQTAR
jgi:hypothetical protein